MGSRVRAIPASWLRPLAAAFMPIRISSHAAPVFVAVNVELVPVCEVASPAYHCASPLPVDALKTTWNSTRFHWFSANAVLLSVPTDVSPGNFHCNRPLLFGTHRFPSRTPAPQNEMVRIDEDGFAIR